MKRVLKGLEQLKTYENWWKIAFRFFTMIVFASILVILLKVAFEHLTSEGHGYFIVNTTCQKSEFLENCPNVQQSENNTMSDYLEWDIIRSSICKLLLNSKLVCLFTGQYYTEEYITFTDVI